MPGKKRNYVDHIEMVKDGDTWHHAPQKLPRMAPIELGDIYGVLPFDGVRNPSGRSNTSHKLFIPYRTAANDWVPKVGIAESAAEAAVAVQALICPDIYDLHFQPLEVTFTDEGGKTRRYTHDLRLTFRCGHRRLVFVRNEASLMKPRTVRDIHAIIAATPKHAADDLIVVNANEQKFSMVVAAKKDGFWNTLSDDAKAALKAADEYIRKRLHIIILYDLASRMPLAWIITENPNAEATLALLRMATRDKTREQRRYGCINEPVRGCGILYLRHDNGTGLRNSTVIGSLMGMGTIDTTTRTYRPEDRAPDERVFGTLESRFFKLMPGYTGRRPGELPGYDAIQNGVVDVETLYGMLTRYLVDEFPFERHYGVGMGGRRPWDVYQEINRTRGQVELPDPNTRRIHLGWEVEATPSDEGVRVFGGIWFNSDELQIIRDQQFFEGKVKVSVDPDNLNIATVLMPGYPDPIEVHLQMTVFADMTIGEVLQLMAEYRREDPDTTDIYHDRLMQAKSRRFAEISSIGVEHDLPRSYSTIEECQKMAKGVFAGSRVIRSEMLPGTMAPGAITSLAPGGAVFTLGDGPSVIDGSLDKDPFDADGEMFNSDGPSMALTNDPGTPPADAPKHPGPRKPSAQKQFAKLARPSNLKELK